MQPQGDLVRAIRLMGRRARVGLPLRPAPATNPADTWSGRQISATRLDGGLMPDTNETIIRLDHDTKTAEVWTPNRGLQARLRRLGATPMDRQIGGQWWQTPAEWWRPRPKRKPGGRGRAFISKNTPDRRPPDTTAATPATGEVEHDA